MELVSLIDFGSTFTKIAIVDLDSEQMLARAQSVSTVAENMMDGLRKALSKLQMSKKAPGNIDVTKKLACSSAAGGLRILVAGLVPELTVEAARRAAFGAGAKVVASYSYELNDDDMRKIEIEPCDLILLAGGIDGGNKDVITHNAKLLAKTTLDIPIIVAGNRIVSSKVAEILRSSGKEVKVTENILPELDKLNVDPARSLIREVFMERIVKAKGLDKAQEYVGRILMPTPMATLRAARLLAEGTNGEEGLGELMVVEVGGATTNIHSIGMGRPTDSSVFFKGLPEPYDKRTVEGDLGIRYNAETILDTVGEDKVLRDILNMDWNTLRRKANFLANNIGFVPRNEEDFLVDAGLARSAVEVAVERHVGEISEVPTLLGNVRIQHGKDLTATKTVIGTGGIFSYGRYSKQILEAVLFSERNPNLLKPMKAALYVDKSYLLYGIGLLADTEPVKALRIAKKYLNRI
ncbi:MAG: methylaspartate mutase accessory protein GlmL [Dehalococcoidia bacterium]